MQDIDDDDDEDVDLSMYDVGTIEQPPPPLPPPPVMPRIGSTVQGKYGRRWQPANVVAVHTSSRCVDVQFIGYCDTVRLGQGCWEAKASTLIAVSDGATGRKRARGDEDASGHDDDLSPEERDMLARWHETRRRTQTEVSTADEDADAPLPGGPLAASSVGHRLLKKMGWRPGEGLGAVGNEGSTVPVAETLKAHDGRGGLKAAYERPRWSSRR